MKTITVFILAIFTFSGFAQEPDTHCYSDSMWNSFVNTESLDIWKDNFDLLLRDGRQIIKLKKRGIDVWYSLTDPVTNVSFQANYLNEEMNLPVNGQQISLLQKQIDSLQILIDTYKLALISREHSVIADSFNFELIDNRIKIEVNKQGHDVWIEIIDGKKRLNADYVRYEPNVMLMKEDHTEVSLSVR